MRSDTARKSRIVDKISSKDQSSRTALPGFIPAGNTGFEDTICVSRRRPRRSFWGGPPVTGALLKADMLVLHEDPENLRDTSRRN